MKSLKIKVPTLFLALFTFLPFFTMMASYKKSELSVWDEMAHRVNCMDGGREPYPSEGICDFIQFSKDHHIPLKEKRILDVGAETGKNALPFLKMGSKVSIVDISSKAMEYTLANIEKFAPKSEVEHQFIGPIESLPEMMTDYDAIVTMYVYSFIHPSHFAQVMKEKVFSRLKEGGYFVAELFGKKHSCAEDPTMTTVTREQIEELLIKNGLKLLKISERDYMTQTIMAGEMRYHYYTLLAKKLKSE